MSGLGNAGSKTRFADTRPNEDIGSPQEKKSTAKNVVKKATAREKQRIFYIEPDLFDRFEKYVLKQKQERRGERINNSVIVREILDDILKAEGY